MITSVKKILILLLFGLASARAYPSPYSPISTSLMILTFVFIFLVFFVVFGCLIVICVKIYRDGSKIEQTVFTDVPYPTSK